MLANKMKDRVGVVREVFALVWTEASGFVKVRLLLALLLITAASTLTALGPVALKLVVDGLATQFKEASTSMAVLIGLYVFSQWLSRTVGEIRGVLYARAERRMTRTLSERLFRHVLYLPLRFHLDRKTGAITQALTNGLQGYQMVLHTMVFNILPIVAELSTMVIVLGRMHQPVFLALFCAAIACYAVVFAYAARRTTGAAREASKSQVDANAALTDSILNFETIKYFNAETLVQRKVGESFIKTEDQWVRFYQQYAVNGLFVASIFALFLLSATVYAAYEVQAGRMTVGTFVLINTYMLQIVRPVETFGYSVQAISQGIAYLEKMLELFHEQAEESAPSTGQKVDPQPPPKPGIHRHLVEVPQRGEIVFENVVLSYRPDRQVLQGVNFKVPAGKTLGVVGSSGAGKSTLVRLLTRLIEPSDGRILLDGVPIAHMNRSTLRDCIAVVPQDTILFHDTIAFNIGFAKEGCTQKDVEEAAGRAHLHKFVSSLPDGYNTTVGERGIKLSGGERQRVSIARAAIKQPRIYVFDEATSSLDSQTEREILANLREIAKSSTTIVIAHRLSTVVHADEIVVLDAGTIVERGTHASLLHLNNHYAKLWAAQQQGAAAA